MSGNNQKIVAPEEEDNKVSEAAVGRKVGIG